MASRVNFNVIKVHCLGLNMIMALKIAEKALASLGAFSTILRAIIMLNPQKWTLMRYYNSLYVFSRAVDMPSGGIITR